MKILLCQIVGVKYHGMAVSVNQFTPGIFLVFPDTYMYTGLFLAKNPEKILAINPFFFLENLMASFFITVVFLRQN